MNIRRRRTRERAQSRAERARIAHDAANNVNVLRIVCGQELGDAHPQHDRTCCTFAGKTFDELQAEDRAERARDGRPAFGQVTA